MQTSFQKNTTEKVKFIFHYPLPSSVKTAHLHLNPIKIEENGFEIKIYYPSSGHDSKQQLLKIQISKNINIIQEELNERTEGVNKLSEKYFQITKDLIRLNTKQFLFDKPVINAIGTESVKIKNSQNTLYERNFIKIRMREVDKNELILDQNNWLKISEYIKNRIEPETYLLILLNAKYNALLGNFRETILLACVAIEEFSINELDCDIKSDPQYKNLKFVDFFYQMTKEITKKDFKTKEHDYYHFLDILFEARNNIAHGRGCFFTPSHPNWRIISRRLKTLNVKPDQKTPFDKLACLTLIDKIFNLLEWIPC